MVLVFLDGMEMEEGTFWSGCCFRRRSFRRRLGTSWDFDLFDGDWFRLFTGEDAAFAWLGCCRWFGDVFCFLEIFFIALWTD